MKTLLIGAGNDRRKKLCFKGEEAWAGELVTVDMNPNCGATLVWDLEQRPLPFADAEFDEIHAYDCLEHWGKQGDWRAWFDEMAEYHRLLKPGGKFAAAVPIGGDHFADPGHTRFFASNHFLFLSQKFYDQQIAAGRPITDYRWYWKLDFDIVHLDAGREPVHHLAVILQKPKERA
jgi:SAM-dependent methyltransferase